MFEWFESRLNPYPTEKPGTPPNGILAFCWHYSGSAWPWLALMSLLTASISISEVYLFGFLGNIIDWLVIVWVSLNVKEIDFSGWGSSLLWYCHALYCFNHL